MNMAQIDDELIRGCERYLSTLKERSDMVEQQRDEQRKVEEQKRFKREQWRKLLYDTDGQGVTVIVPDDSKLSTKGE